MYEEKKNYPAKFFTTVASTGMPGPAVAAKVTFFR